MYTFRFFSASCLGDSHSFARSSKSETSETETILISMRAFGRKRKMHIRQRSGVHLRLPAFAELPFLFLLHPPFFVPFSSVFHLRRRLRAEPSLGSKNNCSSFSVFPSFLFAPEWLNPREDLKLSFRNEVDGWNGITRWTVSPLLSSSSVLCAFRLCTRSPTAVHGHFMHA